MSEPRLTWDEYFLVLAQVAARRATCPRRAVGCVLVANRRVLATGYNGSPPGHVHCDDVGCLMVDGHCVRALHAEQNAVAQLGGVRPTHAYVTDEPCAACLKLLLAVGVREVRFLRPYPSPERDALLAELFAHDPVALIYAPDFAPEATLRGRFTVVTGCHGDGSGVVSPEEDACGKRGGASSLQETRQWGPTTCYHCNRTEGLKQCPQCELRVCCGDHRYYVGVWNGQSPIHLCWPCAKQWKEGEGDGA